MTKVMNMHLRTQHLVWILGISLVLLLPLVLACEGQTATTEESTEKADNATPSLAQGDSNRSSAQSDQSASGDSTSEQAPALRPEFPAEAVDGNYDHDDDGLIEIRTLAQLDAVRLNPEGTGVVQDGIDEATGVFQEGRRDRYFAAFPGIGGSPGCPNQSCAGYELANDLDFDTNGSGEADEGDEYWNDGAGFVPLSLPEGATFDGNGYEISNLYISTDAVFAGLFERSWGAIRNVALVAVEIKAGSGVQRAGGLVGDSHGGTIMNCTVSGSVTGNESVGGLVGSQSHYSTISNSQFSGDVSGTFRVGGLVGNNRGAISGSAASGSVTGDDKEIGGLVGWNKYTAVGGSGRVIDGRFEGHVTGIENVGGLVGRNQREIINGIASGSVTGNENVGGLVGWSSFDNLRSAEVSGMASNDVTGDENVGGLIGLVSQSGGTKDTSHPVSGTARGNVTGRLAVGGLVGRNEGSISDSESHGATTGEENVGGLVGHNERDGTIRGSTASGDVSGVTYRGALVGVNDGGLIEDSDGTGQVKSP